jgi:hypothetical protein
MRSRGEGERRGSKQSNIPFSALIGYISLNASRRVLGTERGFSNVNRFTSNQSLYLDPKGSLDYRKFD